MYVFYAFRDHPVTVDVEISAALHVPRDLCCTRTTHVTANHIKQHDFCLFDRIIYEYKHASANKYAFPENPAL